MTLDTILQWSIVDPTVRTFYTHWTHSNEVCFSNGFPSLAPLRYTHKVHFPRMYLARLLFELRDGISSIYIYIYTRNKSSRSIYDFPSPIDWPIVQGLDISRKSLADVQNETSYTVVWWMILRRGLGMKVRSGGEKLLFNALNAWNESNKTNFLTGWK